MAVGGWVVSSMIRFTTNGIGVMERLSAATNQAAVSEARLRGEITAQEAQWLRLNAAQERTYARHKQLITDIAGGVALAGAASIGYIADQAAKLQQILISIRNETGATAREMSGAYNTIFSIGNRSGMTPIEAGEIMRTVTRMNAGLRMNGRAMTMDQMRSVAPMVADFASMIHFNRPDVDVNEAAMTGLQMAHLFRAYNPQKLGHLFDLNYRLSGMMGESPQQALRQMSYYEPLFKGLGVSDDTSVALMALLDRAGFRNKVGTNVRSQLLEALGPLQLTRSAQHGKASMLERMGIFKNGKFAFNNADGSVDYLGMLGQLAAFGQAEHAKGVPASEIAKIMYGTFGKQGGTIAALMADPQMKDILQGIRDYLHDSNVSLSAGMKNRDSSTVFQFQRAMGNLEAVLIELGTPWLNDLTKFFRGLADNLHNFQQWLHGHRDAEKIIGGTLGGITTLAATIAAGGILSQLGRLSGLLGTGGVGGTAGMAARSIGFLARGLGALVGPEIVAGIAGLSAGISGLAATFAAPAVVALLAALGIVAVNKTLGNDNMNLGPDNFDPSGYDFSGIQYRGLTVRNALRDGRGRGYGFDVYANTHAGGNSGQIVIQNLHMTTDASTVKQLQADIRRNARHAAAKQGVLKSVPTFSLGAADRFLPQH